MKKYLEILTSNGLYDCLETLADNGYCPNLLNDDNGNWALTFSGFQSLRLKDTDDYEGSFFVEARFWKPDLIDAVIYALEND